MNNRMSRIAFGVLLLGAMIWVVNPSRADAPFQWNPAAGPGFTDLDKKCETETNPCAPEECKVVNPCVKVKPHNKQTTYDICAYKRSVPIPFGYCVNSPPLGCTSYPNYGVKCATLDVYTFDDCKTFPTVGQTTVYAGTCGQAP